MTVNINDMITFSKPMLITIEGCDGTGKTTQAKLLHESIKGSILTSDPKGTAYGKLITDEAIRTQDNDWTTAFAFLSARASLVNNVIKPALINDETIICDRFYDSNLVYQGVLGGLPITDIYDMSMKATGGIQPDCTVLLMFDDIETAHDRIIQRAKNTNQPLDRFDSMTVSSMKRLQDGFMSLIDDYGSLINSDRFMVIKCDNKSIDNIHMDIINGIISRFNDVMISKEGK